MKILKARADPGLPYRFRQFETKGWHNETREGATLTTLFTQTATGEREERAYLFGGLSRELHSSLSYMTEDPSQCIFKWFCIKK